MKKLLSALSITTFLLLSISSFAQTRPTKFEPNVISDGGVFGLTISPDSKTALWVKSNGKRDTLQILESHKVNNQWTSPKVASFSSPNGQWKDIDPIFSPDGKMVLFQSTRPVQSAPNRKGFDIWAVKKTKNGWGEAFNLGDTVNTEGSESYASITKKGDIYFMKENPNKANNSDIYVAPLIKGMYQQPLNIGTPVNTTDFRESNPYISPKGDFLIYFSSDSTGFGDVDLYISFNKKGVWSQPKNLGKPINSEMAEFCPFYHKKEKKLYFARQIKAANRMIEDIYSVDFDPQKYRN